MGSVAVYGMTVERRVGLMALCYVHEECWIYVLCWRGMLYVCIWSKGVYGGVV